MISGVSINKAVEQAVERVGEQAKPAGADPSAVNQLQQLLDDPNAGAQAQQGTAGEATQATAPQEGTTEASAAPTVDAATPTPGDKVLQGLAKMQDQIKQASDALNQTLSAPEGTMDTQQMLQAQMQLTRLTTESDLVGKAAGKATQDVNTLLNEQ